LETFPAGHPVPGGGAPRFIFSNKLDKIGTLKPEFKKAAGTVTAASISSIIDVRPRWS
jgi:acetyl-CoA acetyltransferase